MTVAICGILFLFQHIVLGDFHDRVIFIDTKQIFLVAQEKKKKNYKTKKPLYPQKIWIKSIYGTHIGSW